MKEKILEIRSLTKSFNGIIPVNNVTFQIEANTTNLISGENGAGKTTLFNLISGMEVQNKGEIFFENNNISKLSALKRARMGITRFYQLPRLFKNLNVWENLVVASKINKGERLLQLVFNPAKCRSEDLILKDKAIEILSNFEFKDLAFRTAGELSYGQQKIVSFCMILMNEPKLALLDEPFSGINPKLIVKLKEIILYLKSLGLTFLIIEHNLAEAQNLCDKHIIMNKGKVIESIN